MDSEVIESGVKPVAEAEIELVDCDRSCRVLGGPDRPLHRATFYKGIQDGKYPRPIKIGPATSRWLMNELVDCVRARIAERNARSEERST